MLPTGVSTFIKVKDTSGFKSNDFISVDGETLLITGVSSQRSGFYVNRVNNTGIHTIGDGLVALLPNRFSFNIVGEIDDYTFENTTTFFDPKETVGTGVAGTTRTVVGFGTTSFENRFIPTRSIYIPNHNFFTGEKVIYNVGTNGAPLYVNNVGVAQSFGLTDGQELYTANLGLNYIGLSTAGFTTNSSDGIGTTKNSLEFWLLMTSLVLLVLHTLLLRLIQKLLVMSSEILALLQLKHHTDFRLVMTSD